MCAAQWDDNLAILAVKIGALDRPIVCVGNAHVGPVNMTGSDIDHDAIRKTTVADDNLPIGAVRLHRVNTTTAQLENEKSASCALAIGSRLRFCHQGLSHGVLHIPLSISTAPK